MPDTPISWYHATAGEPLSLTHLDGDLNVDTLVIGGGLAGVSTALHLAERGVETALIEAETVGFGASGRNGGQIVQGFSASMGLIKQAVGTEAAQSFWGMAREAVQDVTERVNRHQIDCDVRWGYLHVALNQRQLRELGEMKESWDRYGCSGTELLDRVGLNAWLGSERYVGALVDPESGQIHPLRYLLGLARAALASGATLYEKTPALSIDGNDVKTPKGTIRAKNIVTCGNAYLGKLVPQIYPKLMPVASFVAVTEPLEEQLAKKLFPKDVAVADCNAALDYYRLTEDRRLLFGGGANYSAATPPWLESEMRGKIRRVFPELSDVRIEHLWGGLIGITANRIPDIRRSSTNLYHAQGFSGQGVALTGLAGKIIAEAIGGDDRRLQMFEAVRHYPFPGGPLRKPTLMAVMGLAKLKDALGL